MLAACDLGSARQEIGGVLPGGSEVTFVTEWAVEGRPDGIAVGPQGDVFVNVNNNYRIVRYSATGELLGQWSYDGEVSGIAAGPDGRVYVADRANSRVQVFQP